MQIPLENPEFAAYFHVCMKSLQISAVLLFTASALFADMPISVGELPAPVSATIQEIFPSSEILSASKDEDKSGTEFDVIFRYKNLVLEAELDAAGKLLDLDLKTN